MDAGLIVWSQTLTSLMTLTLDLKVKFWISCMSGMGGPIDMEQKGCESIGCCTHYVILSFDIDLGYEKLDPLYHLKVWPWPQIFKVNFFKKPYPTWNKRDVSW